jgi:hypothetical protein
VGLAGLALAFVQLRRMRPELPPTLSAREALLSRQNQLPLKIAMRQVKAFGGRLWIFVDAALAPGPEKLEAAR